MSRNIIIILLLTALAQSCSHFNPSSDNVETPTTKVPDAAIATPISQGAVPDNFSDQDISITETSLNRSLPHDVIQEVVFFGGLGGVGGGCWEKDYQNPTGLLWEYLQYLSEHQFELMQEIGFTICGVIVGEDVKMRVGLPDGKVEESQAPAMPIDGRDRGEVSFAYIPLLHDLAGTYHFTFHGENWSLEYPYPVEIAEPESARLYLYQSQIYLYKFVPNERVRLLVYSIDTWNGLRKLIGWKEVRVDVTGELQMQTELESVEYIALGDSTGQVNESIPGEFFTNLEIGDIYCDGAQEPVGIIQDEFAEVLVDVLPTYELDSASGKWIVTGQTNLGKGTIVSIASNASCASGTFIRTVRSYPTYQYQFVVPESGPDGYYLRPIENLPPTPTPKIARLDIYQPLKNCASSRLYVGDSVILEEGVDYVSIRGTPDTNPSDNKIGKLLPGDQAKIIDGPECNYDWILWKITRTSDGLTGWVPESNGNEFWLLPIIQ